MFQLVVGGVVEVRPRKASVLACVVLAGTREGLVSPSVLIVDTLKKTRLLTSLNKV